MTANKKGFCCRKTITKEKCVAIVVLIVIVGFVTVLATISTRNTGLLTGELLTDDDFYDDEICATETCNATAELVKSNIDPSVDPCVNFYDYACGGWIKNNPRPEDVPIKDSFSHVRGEVKKSIIALLENETTGMNEPKATINVRKLFRSCMNDEMREKEGVQYFVQLLTELGGWPLLGPNQWDPQGYVWYHHLAAVNRRLNLGIIISLLPSKQNPTTLTLSMPSFLSESSCDDPNEFQSCVQYIMQYARLLGSTLDDDQLYESAMRVVKLDYDLQRIDEYMIPQLGTVQKLESLSENAGSFSWKEYMNLVLKSKIPVTNATNVTVIDGDHIIDFPAFIKNSEASTVANYIGALIVHSLAKYSTPELRRLFYNFTSTEPEAKKSCYEETCNVLMNSACARLFIGQNFSEDMRTDVAEMAEKVRLAYNSSFEQNTWMDKYSKEGALAKLRKMGVYVGYDDWITDNDLLDRHYEPAGDITKENFFEAAVRLITLASNETLAMWSKDAYRGIKNPLAVNAYYRYTQNSIEMSAAYIQFPFYKYGRIKAMNYGSLGFIIGHEMGHAFGTTISSARWMSEATKEKFMEKLDCFIDQYGSLVEPVTKQKVSGYNTVGENMADNAALNNAFKAFRLSLVTSRVNPSQRLVGVDYSPEQLFFLGFASAWCKNISESHLRDVLRRDTHSPSRFRVNIPASNFIEFARAFNCSPGTPMNPEHKCSLW